MVPPLPPQPNQNEPSPWVLNAWIPTSYMDSGEKSFLQNDKIAKNVMVLHSEISMNPTIDHQAMVMAEFNRATNRHWPEYVIELHDMGIYKNRMLSNKAAGQLFEKIKTAADELNSLRQQAIENRPFIERIERENQWVRDNGEDIISLHPKLRKDFVRYIGSWADLRFRSFLDFSRSSVPVKDRPFDKLTPNDQTDVLSRQKQISQYVHGGDLQGDLAASSLAPYSSERWNNDPRYQKFAEEAFKASYFGLTKEAAKMILDDQLLRNRHVGFMNANVVLHRAEHIRLFKELVHELPQAEFEPIKQTYRDFGYQCNKYALSFSNYLFHNRSGAAAKTRKRKLYAHMDEIREIRPQLQTFKDQKEIHELIPWKATDHLDFT